MSDTITYTARTARHALPFLFAGQAQKEFFVNEALARIDALLHPVIAGERADPPAAPEPGDCYLVAPGATGAWQGHDRAIASWAAGTWLFSAPVEGAGVRDGGSGALFVYNAAAGWQRVTVAGAPSGGGIQDAEARAVIATVLAAMAKIGIFSA